MTINELETQHHLQPDMHERLEDPCPKCSGELTVGDYVCWGFCYQCYDQAFKDAD